jgi:diguanylate cyclase (GGDEF)-like protein/PAS domain S-box-containing protein
MPLIVILDDRVTNRNIFARLAASIEEGVEVETYGDPVEALEALARRTPDLVITDFKMPHMNGAEFIRRFRMRPECADVPVVVLTVYEERSFRLSALEAGATDFLLSPVDHHEFLTRARNLLRLRRQQEIIKSRAFVLERELQESEQTREEVLRDSRERLAQVIDTMPAMISAADREGRCVFVNAYQASIYGLDPLAAMGQDLATLLHDERSRRSRMLDELVFRSGKALPSFEEEVVDRSGAKRTFLTDRKAAERHLVHIAHHDGLTGLPNRTLLQDRLRREIARARRGDRFLALHLIDLDRFKAINDALGHHAGDELLNAIAGRLKAAVREVDTVARLGGDEFAILQTDVARPEDAFELAQRVIETMSEPFMIGGNEVVTGASLGIAMHPTDGHDPEELLKNADLAMYRAKAEGRDTYRHFASHMDAAARQDIALEADLRHAIARREFVLHYQPQIDLRTGRIVGAEALVRWERPGHGLVRPGDFLPLAEETGLIIPINEWVLHEACREAKSWTTLGLPDLRIAVNLSPIQFRRQNVRELVVAVLKQTGLAPRLLELELTENIVLDNTEAVTRDIRELQELGVSFSLDDFGTGYSSLAYIKNFPVNRLKIDQCFVRNLKTDPNDAAIVRAVINLGHSLNLEVLAEGVETAEQVAALRADGCDEVQGFFFSKAVAADEFIALAKRDADAALSA